MKWLLFALQILPAILEAIKAVEAALPGAGQGAAKKALIVSTVAASSLDEKSTPISPSDEKSTAIIGKLIDTSVSILNAAGVLKP
jgi:hypothetical protein